MGSLTFTQALKTAAIALLSSTTLVAGMASACAQGTTVVLTPIADARILSIAPDLNQGSLFSIAVYNDGAANVQRSLIRFDLSSIPSDSIVESATLTLVERDTFFTSNGLTTYLYRVTNDWDEYTVTWNSASSAFAGSGGAAYSYALDVPGLMLGLDAAALVQEWITGAYPNYGFLLAAPSGNRLHFHSRESVTGDSRPSLAITYTSPVIHAAGIVRNLKISVEAIVGSGVVLPADGNSLLVKLNATLSSLSAGDIADAIVNLNDFINQVRAFVKTGRLTTAQGESLIGQARAALTTLGG